MYKVVHVISDKNIGGAGILLLGLLRHTDRERFAPLLVLPRGSQLLPRAKALGVPCFTLEWGGDKTLSLAAILPLFRLLWREKPDILHTNASLSARIAALPFLGMAKFDTKHCCFAPTARQTSPFARLCFRAFEELSGVHYIATARAVRDDLLARGSSGKRTRVICGGSERVLPLSHAEKAALRGALGIPEEAFVVGYAARVEKGKGHETMLAAARLLSGRKDVFFLAVGGGSLLPALQKAAEECPNLRFLGFREDIGRVMNLFDLNLNCSYLSETSSLSLSEGMSLGIPLIVTAIGGNPDMARGCGLVVPPRDPRALADAILRLSHDKALYTRLSNMAKRRYAADYSAARMTKKIERFYLDRL